MRGLAYRNHEGVSGGPGHPNAAGYAISAIQPLETHGQGQLQQTLTVHCKVNGIYERDGINTYYKVLAKLHITTE